MFRQTGLLALVKRVFPEVSIQCGIGSRYGAFHQLTQPLHTSSEQEGASSFQHAPCDASKFLYLPSPVFWDDPFVDMGVILMPRHEQHRIDGIEL